MGVLFLPPFFWGMGGGEFNFIVMLVRSRPLASGFELWNTNSAFLLHMLVGVIFVLLIMSFFAIYNRIM